MLDTRKLTAYLGIATAAVLALALAGYAAKLYLDPFDDQRFDSAAWLKANPQQRASMARDAIRHLPTGTTAATVEALLGEPTERFTDQREDWGGNPLRGVKTYEYWLGSWGRVAWDDAFLYVHFDARDRVIASEVNGY